MAIVEVARVKINAGKVSGNNFRFMPGREEDDGRTLFRSLTYTKAVRDDLPAGFIVGAVVGPGKEKPVNTLELTETAPDRDSVVVPIHLEKASETVSIREWPPKPERKPGQEVKKFIDWSTFKEMAPNDVRLMPYLGGHFVNVEVWSGFFKPLTELQLQWVQSGLFRHGSTGIVGGNAKVKARKKIIDPNAPAEDDQLRRAMAKMLYEKHGDVVGGPDGVPQWSARTWEIQYSPKDTEQVVVQHLGTYFLVEVQGGNELVITAFTDGDAKKWERRFLNQFTIDLVADKTKAAIDAGVAKQTAAA